MTITTDLAELVDNRRSPEYQKAQLAYTDQKGMSMVRPIKVKPRGKYRRQYCEFPPLKIKFSKKDLEKEALNPEYNSLKLVTHCVEGENTGKKQVVKEYLAYQLYNLLTDKSFRTQLVKITYVDSKKSLNKISRYGFLIENTREMANRLGGSKCDCLNPAPASLSASDENLMSMFQYMIGNEDWSIKTNRNIKLIKPFRESPMIPVPYDFDFSGIVDANYAVPNRDYRLQRVKDRVFLGIDVGDEQFKATLAHFSAKETLMKDYVLNFQYLSKGDRQKTIKYLDAFYRQMKTISGPEVSNVFDQMVERRLANTTKNRWKAHGGSL